MDSFVEITCTLNLKQKGGYEKTKFKTAIRGKNMTPKIVKGKLILQINQTMAYDYFKI